MNENEAGRIDVPHIEVNGLRIPPEAVQFEFLRLFRFYREHLPEAKVATQMPRLRERAVEQAIGAKLLIDEAARLDVAVTEADVDVRIRRTETEAGGPEKLRALLRRQEIEGERFRDQIRRSCRVEKLVAQIISTAPDPTEAEIRAYFDAHRDDFRQSERAQAQHILVKPADEAPPARETARARIEAIRERIEKGADFAREAAAHSDCPSGKKAGGSLGWVSRGMMVPAFDGAVFNLAVGALSAPVETEFGFHLIRKTAAEPAMPADFDDARESIRELLRHAARGDALAAFVAELRAKANVRIDPLSGS